MSNHIRIRRGQDNIPPGEYPRLAEPKYDQIKHRLGIFNGDAFVWLQRLVGNLAVLNKDQLLTGESSTEDIGNVVLDFSNQNELIIRNRISGTVLCRYTEAGTMLHNPVAVSGAEVGLSNLILNGNLAVKFRAAAPSFPIATTNPASQVIAPNWLLWKKPGSSGNMSVTYDETDFPYGVERSFLCTAQGAPNSSGLRSYIYDHGTLRNREIVVSGWFKGEAGRSCMMRIGNASGTIAQYEFTFVNNVWQEKYFSTIIPDTPSDYLYIDFVYNPSRTNTALLYFRAAKFAVALGQVPPRYESRSAELERSLLHGVFKEGAVFVNDEDYASIDLGLEPGSELDIHAEADDEVVITDANYLGAAVNIPGSTGFKKISYRATSTIRTAETN